MKIGTSVIVTLAIVLAITLVGQAYAHALPVRSDPVQNASLDRSPAQVTVWFSEPLNPLSSRIKVLDSNGVQVDDKNVVFSSDRISMSTGLPNLGKGVYTVSWVSVSATDGHLQSGSFPFGIQEVVPPPPSTQQNLQPSILSLLPETLVRWTFYLGATMLVGGSTFYLLVFSPVMRRRRTPSTAQTSKSVPEAPVITPKATRRLAIMSLIGAAVAAAGTVGLIVTQINASESSSATTYLIGTQLGVIGIARLALISASAVIILLGIKTGKPSISFTLSLLGGLGVLFSSSLSGHNAAVQTLPILSILVDMLHLIGVSIWVGGLIHFSTILPVLRKEGQLHMGLLRLVPRFSRVAVISVGIITISGLYSTLFQIGSFSALFGSEYGLTLVLKMILTACLIFFGAMNQLIWYPRITNTIRTLGQMAPGVGKIGHRLSRSIRTQVIIGAGLILVVGLLTALPPAYQVSLTQNRPTLQATTFSQRSNGVNVALSVYPFRVGANSFSVVTTDSNGNPVANIVQVILDFTYKDAPLPPATTNATLQGGQYIVQGTFLGRSGNWAIQVTVRRSGAFDTITRFDANLPAYPGFDSAKVWEIPYTSSSINGFDTMADGSGNIWFSAPFPGILARYTPGSNSFQIFQPPNSSTSPGVIVQDRNGRIWYADQTSGNIASLDPATSSFSSPVSIPFSNAQIGGITVDSNNTIWVTAFSPGNPSQSRVLGYNQTSNAWISYLTILRTPTNSSALGPITIDQRGLVWFEADAVPPANGGTGAHGEVAGNGKIEMLNQTSRTIREFLPPKNATIITGILASLNGDIWFAEHGTNRISKISPSNNYTFTQISLDALNPQAFPWGVKMDSQGNIWFAEHIGNKIGFYDLTKNQFTEWSIPTSQSDSKLPALDQFGNVWFAEGQGGSLGVLALQPRAIGLGAPGNDFYYELLVGASMAAIGVVSFRWQRLVRFFSRNRKRARAVETKAVKEKLAKETQVGFGKICYQ